MVPHLAFQEPLALSAALSSAERRRYQRHILACRCWLEADDLTICGPTADVGVGGLFLRTAIPLRTGSVVDVFMQVPGSADPLSAKACVTRTVAARSGTRHGVGVEFLQIKNGKHALSKWLTTSATLPWC